MAPEASSAVRRSQLIRWSLAAAYLLSTFGAGYLIANVNVPRPVALAIGALPGLAIAGIFYITFGTISAMKDEFMRLLAVREQLIAAGFALSIASVWSTLEMFNLAPNAPIVFIFVVWAFGLLIGRIANRITHGVWGTDL
jgi:hypothetical protein